MKEVLDPEISAATLIGAIDGLLLQYFVDAKALPTPDKLADSLAALTRRMVTA